MKKLLIFMLVLGMASVANATLTAVAPVITGALTWDIVGAAGFEKLEATHDATATVNWNGWGLDRAGATVNAIGPINGSSSYTGSLPLNSATPTPYPNAGNLAKVFDGLVSSFPWNGWDLVEGAIAPSAVTPSSVWYVFDVASTGTIDIWDYTGMTIVGTVTVIPEPMTIALLGLGSLFLLRRRK